MDEIISPALMRLRNKPETPRIDFTVYTQEDGTTVSTRDRVIKGNNNRLRNIKLLFIRISFRCACTCRNFTNR